MDSADDTPLSTLQTPGSTLSARPSQVKHGRNQASILDFYNAQPQAKRLCTVRVSALACMPREEVLGKSHCCKHIAQLILRSMTHMQAHQAVSWSRSGVTCMNAGLPNVITPASNGNVGR